MSRLEDICRQLDVVAKGANQWAAALITHARELNRHAQILMRSVQQSNSNTGRQAIAQIQHAAKRVENAAALLNNAEQRSREWITASMLSSGESGGSRSNAGGSINNDSNSGGSIGIVAFTTSEMYSTIEGLTANPTTKGELCGVPINGGQYTNTYRNILITRHDNAEPTARKIYDRYSASLTIQNANLPVGEIQHYNPSNDARGVYLNVAADEKNPRGAGTTFYHEIAHMIDHAAKKYNGYISETSEFATALFNDGHVLLEQYHCMNNKQRESFNRLLNKDSSHSLSDLLDAITNGEIAGMYGHSREYWSGSGSLQHEAFAHFFEASMGNQNKMQMLAFFFPTSFPIFLNMIDSLDIKPFVKTLRR